MGQEISPIFVFRYKHSIKGSDSANVTKKLDRIVNISFRSLTLISRFLLLFLLARLLEPSDVGLYGLVAATVGYALYLVGFDFYIYTTREVIKHDRSYWGGLLKNQAGLLIVLYLIFLPLLTLVFWLGLLPWYLAPWCAILLFMEHLSQELMRLLVAVSRPLMASLVLFLRSGLWVFALAAIMLVRHEAFTLLLVLQFWALGGIMAATAGIVSLTRMNISGWKRGVDWTWVKRGLKIAIPFLLATLCIRGIYTVDRYWFEALAGLETLAAYVLFIGIAGALGSFLEAGVFTFEYPALIQNWHDQSPDEFRHRTGRLLRHTVLFSGLLAILMTAAMPLFLVWLDRPIYQQNSNIFPYLLLAMMLFSFSMVPHYLLYAQGRDKTIIFGHVIAFLCFVVATWILSAWTAVLAVPIALCVAFAMLLVWKVVGYLILTPHQYQFFVRLN